MIYDENGDNSQQEGLDVVPEYSPGYGIVAIRDDDRGQGEDSIIRPGFMDKMKAIKA